MNPFTVFFKNFDPKYQDPFLNKSLWQFFPKQLSEAAITLSICIGINVLKQYFYIQQQRRI